MLFPPAVVHAGEIGAHRRALFHRHRLFVIDGENSNRMDGVRASRKEPYILPCQRLLVEHANAPQDIGIKSFGNRDRPFVHDGFARLHGACHQRMVVLEGDAFAFLFTVFMDEMDEHVELFVIVLREPPCVGRLEFAVAKRLHINLFEDNRSCLVLRLEIQMAGEIVERDLRVGDAGDNVVFATGHGAVALMRIEIHAVAIDHFEQRNQIAA